MNPRARGSFALMLAVLASVVAAGCGHPQASDTRYVNEDYRFSFDHPKSLVQSRPQPATPKGFQFSLSFMDRSRGTGVIVEVNENPQEMLLYEREEFADFMVGETRSRLTHDAVGSAHHLKIVEIRRTTLNGLPGVRAECRGGSGGERKHGLTYYLWSRQYMYTLMLVSAEETWPANRIPLTIIAQSFTTW